MEFSDALDAASSICLDPPMQRADVDPNRPAPILDAHAMRIADRLQETPNELVPAGDLGRELGIPNGTLWSPFLLCRLDPQVRQLRLSPQVRQRRGLPKVFFVWIEDE